MPLSFNTPQKPKAKRATPERNHSRASVGMAKEAVTARTDTVVKPPARAPAQVFCRSGAGAYSCRDGHALDSNKFQIFQFLAFHLEAERDRLANIHHELVE